MRQDYQLGILDLLALSGMVALLIEVSRSAQTHNPLVLIGWTGSCLLQVPMMRSLYVSAWKVRDYHRDLSFNIGFPVCFIPLFAWLLVTIVHILALTNVASLESTRSTLFVTLIPAGMYSIGAIAVSFWVGRRREWGRLFLRLRILAIYNSVIAFFYLRS